MVLPEQGWTRQYFDRTWINTQRVLYQLPALPADRASDRVLAYEQL
ncbi:MAG: hypothetical protein NTW21_32080 [Verrucomicrobia bacterium]|nr:hypothetical protein [Verrucomicrobiota bacterium]